MVFSLFTLYTTTFPIYRGFMMLIAVVMLISVYLILTRTRIGLVIQAALTHPNAVEALGHNVPRVFMLVFGGGKVDFNFFQGPAIVEAIQE